MSDRLHDFAKAIATRQTEVADDVDAATIDAIARDLGMSDDEILAARAEGQARQQRARALRQRGLFDEAIAELDQAHAWNPLDVETMTDLADCLVRRARKTNDASDYERASRLCHHALRAAPANREAPALLQQMQMNPLRATTTLSMPMIIGLSVASTLLALAIALAVLLR
jgi:tetratricopeptide (TPR) repeat protein